jgi:endonuclease/exonuclease/phosphatase (EEP) superfamily protein YafD
MLFRNDNLSGLEADIRAADPDVITLQEVSPPNEALLAALADRWPHQHFCPFARVGGTAVVTRLPPLPGRKLCAPGLAAVEVTGPQGPLWLVSVHLHWPWPYRQSAQLKDLLPLVETMESPVVMAGDFNMVPWSNALAALRWAGGVENAGPTRATYLGFAPWLRLPIDQILAPGGGLVETRPALGSDHLGLRAVVHLAAP